MLSITIAVFGFVFQGIWVQIHDSGKAILYLILLLFDKSFLVASNQTIALKAKKLHTFE